jgi:DNA-binding transcriptional LysR family regulator
MDVRQLRHFLAIVESGSYARAANNLNMSQSALTQSILKLEESVDVRLFQRGRSGATITEAGTILGRRARLIMAELQLAEAELRDIKDAKRGSINIGLGRSLTSGPIANVLATFAIKQKHILLTVNEGWSPDLFQRLMKGDFDLVLSSPQPNIPIDPEINIEPLFSQWERPVISRHHKLASRKEVTLADIGDGLWALPPRGNMRVQHLHNVFNAAGLSPPTHFIRSDSDTFGQWLIRRGLAVGLANVHILEAEIALGDIIVLPLPELAIERQVCLATRRRSRLKAIATQLAEDVRRAVRRAP